MAELFFKEETPQHVCWDRKYYNTFEDQLKVLKTSKTVYVGNLSFFTTEQQIHEAFSVVGPIKRIIMGLNQHTNTPCGFCFVEYYSREQAAAALKNVSGTVCDDRIIRCDMDGGFRPGRQFGRGRSGGQMRDDRNATLDPARGGGTTGLRAERPPHPVTGKRAREERQNEGGNVDVFGREVKRDPLSSVLPSRGAAPASLISASAAAAAAAAASAGAVVQTDGAALSTDVSSGGGDEGMKLDETERERSQEDEDDYTDGRHKRSRRADNDEEEG